MAKAGFSLLCYWLHLFKKSPTSRWANPSRALPSDDSYRGTGKLPRLYAKRMPIESAMQIASHDRGGVRSSILNEDARDQQADIVLSVMHMPVKVFI